MRPRCQWLRAARGCCVCLLVARALPAALEPTKTQCNAGASPHCTPLAKGSTRQPHHWPHARGQPGLYGLSPHIGPLNLSASFAWSWHHPEGRYHTLTLGSVLDGDGNVYLAAEDGIRKFSPDSVLLWMYTPRAPISSCPSIMGGALYGNSVDGHVYSLDLESGRTFWSVRPAYSVGGDTHYIQAHDGIVVVPVDAGTQMDAGAGNRRIVALNATNGQMIWDFVPDTPLWNFMAIFDGNGGFIFQNYDAGVYRLRLADGKVLWRAGRHGGATWTDGGAILGPNGLVYAVSAADTMTKIHPDLGGGLHAYRLSDGGLQWERTFARPIYTWPAVGALRVGADLSVVTGIGSNPLFPWKMFATQSIVPGVVIGLLCGALLPSRCCCCCCRHSARWKRACFGTSLGATLVPLLFVLLVQAIFKTRFGSYASPWSLGPIIASEVVALDAQTGEAQWNVELPPWRRLAAAGDEEGYITRTMRKARPICLPPAFSSPTIDAAGTIYIGHMSGGIFVIRDEDGNGRIDEGTEVSLFDAGAAFLHAGMNVAPSMLAIASCDSLFVFRY